MGLTCIKQGESESLQSLKLGSNPTTVNRMVAGSNPARGATILYRQKNPLEFNASGRPRHADCPACLALTLNGTSWVILPSPPITTWAESLLALLVSQEIEPRGHIMRHHIFRLEAAADIRARPEGRSGAVDDGAAVGNPDAHCDG